MKKMLIIVDCSIFSEKIAEYFSEKYEVFCLCKTDEEKESYAQKLIKGFKIEDDITDYYKNADIILNCSEEIDERVLNKLFDNVICTQKRVIFNIILNSKKVKKHEDLLLNNKKPFYLKQIVIQGQMSEFKLDEYYMIFDRLDNIIENDVRSFYIITIK